MSRIIERRFVLGDVEKERLLNRMRQLAVFGGIEILAYSFLSNHFHVLAYVPEKREVTDAELIERLGHIFQPYREIPGTRKLS
ncbi:MAG: hypothetical protein A2498_16205 [Lentisphaerae bacterium RIFOXYC12_FULL_60_16]|nr:MAG: hypothetical protein A2498_16205 [Lentisphaerae bacterium RIFOXYC12_FULL_60_16]OGV75775.1 MAG: hypothetical protein A2340_09755 [Lentisphaerae bacterium RIFOXYB12_FULL_60_10]